ncbi:V-type ATP synthase subunit F, partial [Deinococcus sp. GbtcB9]|uniref:V-type ATP synthase subunit F n=1 Tax=Deinococcus sp. GbtcB9 TaxID=2824754 RepID=UPI001C30F340
NPPTGTAVIEAPPDTALATLERLITEGQYGLAAVDTGLIPDPASATARVMRGRDLPTLLPIPSLRDAFNPDTVDAKAYM